MLAALLLPTTSPPVVIVRVLFMDGSSVFAFSCAQPGIALPAQNTFFLLESTANLPITALITG